MGADFDPGVGYIRRRGMRHNYATIGAHPQRPLPILQEINPTWSSMVPAGDYDYREGSISFTSSAERALSGSVTLSGGEFFGGTRRSLGMNALWRASHRLSLDVWADRNDLRLPESAFTADVFGARLEYAYSTRLFGSAFAQYNAATDFFLVFTERRDVAEGRVLERVLTAKLTRLVAF